MTYLNMLACLVILFYFIFYTHTLTGSGHVKYKRNFLACKMHENSACSRGDSTCNTSLPLSLILITALLVCVLHGQSSGQFDMATHLLQNMPSAHIKVKKGVAMYFTCPLPVTVLRVQNPGVSLSMI